jgi:hypothetical protein
MRKITFFKMMFVAIALITGGVNIQAQLTEGFETGLPTSYSATTSCTLGSGTWTCQENGIIRSIEGVTNGTYSCLLRSQTGAHITSPNIPIGGVSTVTFWASASTSSGALQVKFSTNGGLNWTPAIESPFSLTTGTPVQKTATINSSSSNILIQFYRTGGTVYLDDIVINTSTTPYCTSSTLAFSNTTASKIIGDAAFTETATSLNGTTAITYASNNTAVATVNETNGEVTLVGTGEATITATQAAGTHNEVDYCAANAAYTLFVTTTLPTITVTEVTVPAMTAYVGNAKTETVNVSGINLTGDLTVSIIDDVDNQFDEPSISAITKLEDNTASGTVTVTYRPTIAGTHTATLKFESPDATTVTRQLNGTATIAPSMPDVIITEVYGGGGNSGATYKNDFIELYNTTESSIEIGGWSIQYYTATNIGVSTNNFVIPAGETIVANKYFLIQAATAGGGTINLPTPDAVCTLGLSATAGKVILYATNEAQTISDLNSITGNAYFKDYVPFGTTATPVWVSATAAPSNTTSASRKMANNLYQYTPNIGLDFEIIAPDPKNSGFTTGIIKPEIKLIISTDNNNLKFTSNGGETVEIYNALGQKLVQKLSVAGLNTIPLSTRGVVLVIVGDCFAKVIL